MNAVPIYRDCGSAPRFNPDGSGLAITTRCEMFKSAIPVLHVSSSATAEKFYCESLGFQQKFAYRPFGGSDPCYMGLTRDEVVLHVSSFSGDGVSGGVVFLVVADVMRCTRNWWRRECQSISNRRIKVGETGRCT